jgi:hypothetical protein
MKWYWKDHRGKLHQADINVLHTPHLLNIMRWLQNHLSGSERLKQLEEVKAVLRHRGKLP